MTRQYCCIIFCNESDTDNESVAEIPVTWLYENNTFCKWPPSPALVSLYINRYKNPMDNWLSFKVKVTATFATLEEARNFNKGTNNSESCGRRQVRSPDIYSPDEFVEPRKVRRPVLPPRFDVAMQSGNRDSVQLYNESSQNKVYTLLEAVPNLKSIQSEDDVAEASGYSYSVPNPKLIEIGDDVAEASECQYESGDPPIKSAIQREDDVLEATGYLCESSDPPNKSVESSSNEKIINLLLDIKLEIANLTNKMTEQGIFNADSDPILENLPLKNLEDFRYLEGKLDTDPVLKKKLYKTFESIGGNGSRDFVIRCLKRSFTNEMAELCSWTGQKDNYKVAESPLMKILYSAVKKTTGVSENDFEISVKDWLRHAKQRKERMLKKSL